MRSFAARVSIERQTPLSRPLKDRLVISSDGQFASVSQENCERRCRPESQGKHSCPLPLTFYRKSIRLRKKITQWLNFGSCSIRLQTECSRMWRGDLEVNCSRAMSSASSATLSTSLNKWTNLFQLQPHSWPCLLCAPTLSPCLYWIDQRPAHSPDAHLKTVERLSSVDHLL